MFINNSRVEHYKFLSQFIVPVSVLLLCPLRMEICKYRKDDTLLIHKKDTELRTVYDKLLTNDLLMYLLNYP